jgi:hypothetical protein
MTKSLNIQKPPKKSACDPQTFVCLRAFNSSKYCSYYQKIESSYFAQCAHQGILIPVCTNKQAWPKETQKQRI